MSEFVAHTATEKELVEILQGTGLPVRYSHFQNPQEPPFIVYLGNGQETMGADDTVYWKRNQYQIEYYFTEKDPTQEAAIEAALTDAGLYYEKSPDAWISGEGLFVIYYYV